MHAEKPRRADGGRGARPRRAGRAPRVRLSCAPATLLGEAQQTAWKLVRDGALGARASMLRRGELGSDRALASRPRVAVRGGAALDVAVYPITILTAMFGPVRRVTGTRRRSQPVRTRIDGRRVHARDARLPGVELEHEDGVVTRLTATFWVGRASSAASSSTATEGRSGSPTGRFDSRLELLSRDGEDYEPGAAAARAVRRHRLGRRAARSRRGDREGRPHRMGAGHAAHVVEALDAADVSRRRGRAMGVESTFEPPPPLEWGAMTDWFTVNLRDASWRYAPGQRRRLRPRSRPGPTSSSSASTPVRLAARASRWRCTTGRPTRRTSWSSPARRS